MRPDWRHFFTGKYFRLITDQLSVSFMLHVNHKNKIKNDKIYRCRTELQCYSYDIVYRKGDENTATDTFSRVYCAIISTGSLYGLHKSLCHPGITRMSAFVCNRNLPFSVEDIHQMNRNCGTCCKIKTQFHKPHPPHLIKATQPFERLNIDFKGPIPSASRNKYFLTIIDEYSHFPFVSRVSNTDSPTVITCLSQLFSIFGMPSYIHSDRGL